MKTALAILLALPFLASAQSADHSKKDISKRRVLVYTTAENSSFRLTKTDSLQFTAFKQPLETQPSVFVDTVKKFQSIVGIGGALTDAAAETFYKLSKGVQKELLKAYYDPQAGIGYTMARTSINSADFSSDTYTYVTDNDPSLKTFNLKHDLKYKMPLIKAAIAAAGGKLPLLASPWSPPAWMKDNNDMLNGGKLLPQYGQVWADYFVKFIKAYEANQIPVWGITTQNEPMAKQKWESCIFTAEEERDFIKKYLGPTLQAQKLSDKKLIGWDHNRDLMYQRATVLLNDAEAAKYIWGIGFHWYETWTGSAMQFDNVKKVKETFPDKNLIFTEGCLEKFDFAKINDWALGERYGNSMINDFNAGTAAWIDWNVLLDQNGGPNHVGNFCFAPIHADLTTGKLIYTNAYYYLGHFSKFIRPGARRIDSSTSRSALQSTAFINTDGQIAVVVMNNTDQKIPYHLWIAGKGAETVSLPHSISTLVIQ